MPYWHMLRREPQRSISLREGRSADARARAERVRSLELRVWRRKIIFIPVLNADTPSRFAACSVTHPPSCATSADKSAVAHRSAHCTRGLNGFERKTILKLPGVDRERGVWNSILESTGSNYTRQMSGISTYLSDHFNLNSGRKAVK